MSTDHRIHQLHLRDRSPGRVAGWSMEFKGVAGVVLSAGDIFGATADAIVSPANSFGYMDGGIDLAYVEHFGWDLEDRVRAAIARDWGGELPVGCALVVPTEATPIRWLVCAPTMRVPMKIQGTANAYLALRAALRAVEAHNAHAAEDDQIRSLLCPGLGTGVGQLAISDAARQMRAAWEEHRQGHTAPLGGLAGQSRRHLWLVRGEEI